MKDLYGDIFIEKLTQRPFVVITGGVKKKKKDEGTERT